MRRCHLDRQRHAVQVPAEIGGIGDVVRVQRERVIDRPRALLEQLRRAARPRGLQRAARRRDRQWSDPIDLLAGYLEWKLGGGEEAHAGRAGKHRLDELRRAIDQMLAVVHDQQRMAGRHGLGDLRGAVAVAQL